MTLIVELEQENHRKLISCSLYHINES